MSKEMCPACRGSGILRGAAQHGEATQCDCECGDIHYCDECGSEIKGDVLDGYGNDVHYCEPCIKEIGDSVCT